MGSTISDIAVKTINGKDKQLSEYTGKVLLIVNVASYCGYTSQYDGLEKLNQEFGGAGLSILGFPCNDFGAQEPGSNEEIVQFCTSKYGVSFYLFDKVHAKGSQQHPLYERLTKAVEPTGPIAWNFEKFLVNKQGESATRAAMPPSGLMNPEGEVVARFSSSVQPYSPELIATIKTELAK